MKVIEYKLIDKLEQLIQDCKKEISSFAQNKEYSWAASSDQAMKEYQFILDLIQNKYVRDIPDNDITEDGYTYLNAENVLAYMNKKVEFSDDKNFAHAETAILCGYDMGAEEAFVTKYEGLGFASWKYARVRKDIR